MAGDARKNTSEDEEVVPVDKVEDLPEVHQKQYTTIVDDLMKKPLAMYGRSRHGHIKSREPPIRFSIKLTS